MRKKVIKALVLFFCLMIVFTILSRAAYNISTPKVIVGQVKEMEMGPEVSAGGIVEASRELAVTTVAQQIVKTVCVIPGQEVKKGEVLFELDMETLEENIGVRQNELKGMELQIKSARSAQEVARKARDMEQSQAQADYEKALESEDEEMILQAKRAVDRANMPVAEDTSIEQMKLSKQSVEKAVEELVALRKSEGKILSPTDGVISEVNVKVGSMTAGFGDVMIADASSNLIIKAQFSEESKEHIYRGAVVEIISNVLSANGVEVRKKLKIDAVGKSPDGSNNIEATVKLPKDSLPIGASATMQVATAKKVYSGCLPLEALHQGEGDIFYIYVLDTKKSMLGDEIVAKRLNVNVEYKGEWYAAVGGVGVNRKVILSSDRQLKDGGRVKPQEQ